MLSHGFLLLLVTPFFAQAATDHYPDFATLARSEKEGADFRVEAKVRPSRACVLAIHGGRIEPGTERVAREVAGGDLSLYVFEGTKPEHNRLLHVTSAHFDDPRAVAIAKGSETCASIHGFKEEERDIVCVGGGNVALRGRMARALEALHLPLTVESPCERFGGASAANIVNRAKSGGVQLEISTHLRGRLDRDAALFKRLTRAVRQTLLGPS